MVKQVVALRQADSRPPRWQVFWMTLMECGWKDRLTLIWTTLLELPKEEVESKEAEELLLHLKSTPRHYFYTYRKFTGPLST